MYPSDYELEWLAQARMDSCASDARQIALQRLMANEKAASPGRQTTVVGRVIRAVGAPLRIRGARA